MKTRYISLATALLATLAVSGIVYAQGPVAPGKNVQAAGGNAPRYGTLRRARIEDALAQLPPEKAGEYKDAMRKAGEKNKPIFDKIRKLREEKTALMTAEKFDAKAFTAKVAELDKQHAEMCANRNAALLSVLSKFSAEERKVIARLDMGPAPQSAPDDKAPPSAPNDK